MEDTNQQEHNIPSNLETESSEVETTSPIENDTTQVTNEDIIQNEEQSQYIENGENGETKKEKLRRVKRNTRRERRPASDGEIVKKFMAFIKKQADLAIPRPPRYFNKVEESPQASPTVPQIKVEENSVQ